MSRSKHSEAEMVGAIRQMDAGRKAEDVARDVHREALTTRLLFLFSLARKTRIGNQNFLTLQSMHAKAGKVAHLLGKISGWFENFKAIA